MIMVYDLISYPNPLYSDYLKYFHVFIRFTHLNEELG